MEIVNVIAELVTKVGFPIACCCVLFTQNNNLKLYIYIMISGVGQALIIRLADMLRLMMQIRKS